MYAYILILKLILNYEKADNQEKRPSVQVFKKFLSTSHYFMLEGFEKISNLVAKCVEDSTKLRCGLKDSWTIKDLQDVSFY